MSRSSSLSSKTLPHPYTLFSANTSSTGVHGSIISCLSDALLDLLDGKLTLNLLLTETMVDVKPSIFVKPEREGRQAVKRPMVASE